MRARDEHVQGAVAAAAVERFDPTVDGGEELDPGRPLPRVEKFGLNTSPARLGGRVVERVATTLLTAPE